MEVKVYRTFCDELEQYWRVAEQEFKPFVFHTYDWCQTWYEKKGHGNSNLFIFVVKKHGQIEAIFPFCLNSILSVKVLSLLGGRLADYQAPLVKSTNELQTIWSKIEPYLPKHDVLSLNRLPVSFSLFTKGIKGQIQTLEIPTAAIYLPTEKTALEECISKRKIKDLRRYERRLSEYGYLSFDVYETFYPESDIINFLIEQKKLQYKKTGVRNILADNKVEKFYRELSEINSGDSGVKVHLSTLRIGKKIIAAHLGLVHQGHFYYLMPSYLDDELSKFSPGSVLLYFLIRWSVENKFEVFDLTIGNESYKSSWSNNQSSVHSIVKPNSFLGWFFSYAILVVSYLKNNKTSRNLLKQGVKFFRLLRLG